MRHDEDDLQIACVRWFDWQYPRQRMARHHSPNGGWRTKAQASIFKAMGCTAGFPDLMVFAPGRMPLAVEFKTRTGRQSEAQKEWQRWWQGIGGRYEVVRSLDVFIYTVNGYMNEGETK